MVALLLAQCGHLTPVSYTGPMLAPCANRSLRHSRSTTVRRLGSTTGGTEGMSRLCLLIFHRHGDRSPLKGHTPDEELSPPTNGLDSTLAPGGLRADGDVGVGSQRGAEASRVAAATAEEFWRDQLILLEDVDRLNALYPLRISPGEAVPPDEVSAPFGCLTSLGLGQLQERGRRLRKRYSQYDVTSARVNVFSTNYRRTQLSAQGFLDGFLEGEGGVPVVVRPCTEDFLNQWESQGQEMHECMLSVESDPSFQERESSIGEPLKRRLNNLDPGLFPLSAGARFRWMMAADYFMSARARGLQIRPELDAVGTATIRFLTWRFSRYYGDKKMIRTMVGPLLAHIVQCAEEDTLTDEEAIGFGNSSVDGSRSVISRIVSSSCHDVTTLALLYAMESDLVENEDYWPPYGSTIEFAVSKPQQASWSGGKGGLKEALGEEEVRLTVTVDDEPLRSRLFSAERGCISLSDFKIGVGDLLPL